MKALWQVTSSRIGLRFVALGVLLADANQRGFTAHDGMTSNGPE